MARVVGSKTSFSKALTTSSVIILCLILQSIHFLDGKPLNEHTASRVFDPDYPEDERAGIIKGTYGSF